MSGGGDPAYAKRKKTFFEETLEFGRKRPFFRKIQSIFLQTAFKLKASLKSLSAPAFQ